MGSVLIKMAGIPSNSSRILERLGWNKKKNLSSALQHVLWSSQLSRHDFLIVTLPCVRGSGMFQWSFGNNVSPS